MITPNQLFRSTINHFIIWWVLVCYKGGTKILCKTAIIHLYKNGINFLWQKASLYFPKKIAVENKCNLKIRLYTYIYIYLSKILFCFVAPCQKKKKKSHCSQEGLNSLDHVQFVYTFPAKAKPKYLSKTFFPALLKSLRIKILRKMSKQ